VEVEDERQQKVLNEFRMDSRIQEGADLLETSLENLRTIYQARLKQVPEAIPEPQAPVSAERHLVYLIYDQRDAGVVFPWAEFLFQQGIEVIRPVFEGDEAEVREYHEENLCGCDGALILYGGASECWLRRKLREVQKSAGYGRTKPMPAVAISLVPPKTGEKETFRTHEAMVIPQMDGFSPDPMRPFISRLTGS
jgi:hypothetical protein